MTRKPLPYLFLALLGGAGFFVWKGVFTPPASPLAAPVRSTHVAARTTPQPTRLDFLTDTGQSYQVRISLLRNTLSTECSEPELRYLYSLLEKPAPKGELPEHWFVIANDIMTKILTYENDPQRFSANFIGLLNDSQQPEVIRDYAVQYLAAWLNPRSAQATAVSLATPSPEIAAQVLQSLVSAMMDPALEPSSIPGTTLMMLVDLKRSEGGVDCTQAIATLKPWLSHALQDGSKLNNSVRVSAVSAAGILAPTEFRPIIRKIAYQENGSSSLRLPAIAALGQSGESEDLSKLQQIASSSPELAYAAQDAGKLLKDRISKP
jgi:hypothetical protein